MNVRDYFEQDIPSTAAEIDQNDAWLIGSRNVDKAWILSDRDVWYRNPYYVGPAVPHPDEIEALQLMQDHYSDAFKDLNGFRPTNFLHLTYDELKRKLDLVLQQFGERSNPDVEQPF